MKFARGALVALALTVLSGSAALSAPALQAAGVTQAQEQLFEPGILEAFVDQWDVTIDQAAEQLAVQEDMDAIEYAALDPAFAEVYTVPGSQFEIVYATASSSMPPETERELERLGLLTFVRQVSVPHSIDTLTAAQERVKRAIDQVGLQADLDLDVQSGTVLVETPQVVTAAQQEVAEASTSRMSVPVAIAWNQTDSLAQPAVGGGRAMRTCTAGFVVKHDATNNRGISTAGHCDSWQTYAGQGLVHMQQAYGGHTDVQWHDADITWHKRFYDGSGDRRQTDRKYWGGMQRNDSVCKYGKETGYDCGTIMTKYYCPDYVPSCANTFVTVNGQSDMSNGGDSGGPYFVGGTAWGLQSGQIEPGNRGVYMPQQYVNVLGLRVATH